MSLNTKTGRLNQYIKDKENVCLTGDQARHIYKNVDSEIIVNIGTIKQEIEAEKLDCNKIEGDEINPFHEIITNTVEKEDTITLQMEQWSILGTTVNNVQYDRHPKDFYDLDVKTIDQKNHKKIYDIFKEEERQILELDFVDTPEKLRGDYLDIYKGIQPEVKTSTRFGENSDFSTTYLGRTDLTRASKIKAEENFPISEQGYMIRKLLEGTECQILLDTGPSKSFVSKSHYLWCKSLHSLPTFVSKLKEFKWGNGQFISVLFIIPIVHGHIFKIFTLVSEIHENIDLVFGIKNIFELEGIINSQESCFSFLTGQYLSFLGNRLF